METGDFIKLPAEDSKINNNLPASLRLPAHIISFIFHPIFIPTWIMAFFVFRHPYAFAGVNANLKLFRFLSVIFLTAFLPSFSIFLMKQLGFIQSIFLRTQKDRIIPYIVSMVFYFWAWYVSKNIHDDPSLTAMLLATFLGCIAGMMANIYFKISMHGIAVGALVTLFIWLSFNPTVSMGIYLAVAIFITGLVCTARLIVSDHSPFEVYAGLFAGIICQLIAIGIAA